MSRRVFCAERKRGGAPSQLARRPTPSVRHRCHRRDYFADCREWIAETDKAWDAIHRALTNGRLGGGETVGPLNVVVIGGEQLYGRSDWLLSLKTPQQIRDAAPSLSAITQDEF